MISGKEKKGVQKRGGGFASGGTTLHYTGRKLRRKQGAVSMISRGRGTRGKKKIGLSFHTSQKENEGKECVHGFQEDGGEKHPKKGGT